MAIYTFLYRCPTTGHKVQAVVADVPAPDQTNTYDAVTCAVCSRVHLVNPNSGRVLGSDAPSAIY